LQRCDKVVHYIYGKSWRKFPIQQGEGATNGVDTERLESFGGALVGGGVKDIIVSKWVQRSNGIVW
jgi:hypothetical protein